MKIQIDYYCIFLTHNLQPSIKASIMSSPVEKKSVHFNRRVKCKWHIARNSYTQEEIENTWWQSDDYAQIRRDAKKTIDLMELDYPFDEVTNTSKGLEGRTTRVIRKRILERRKVLDVVFDEQYRQWQGDEEEPEKIAACYSELSRVPVLEATFRAREIRLEVCPNKREGATRRPVTGSKKKQISSETKQQSYEKTSPLKNRRFQIKQTPVPQFKRLYSTAA